MRIQQTHHRAQGASPGRQSCHPSCTRRVTPWNPRSQTAGGALRPGRTATWRLGMGAGGLPTPQLCQRQRRTRSERRRSSSRLRKVKCCSWPLLPETTVNSLSVLGMHSMLPPLENETRTVMILVLRGCALNHSCRLSSGARVVIQYTIPCNESDEGSEHWGEWQCGIPLLLLGRFSLAD